MKENPHSRPICGEKKRKGKSQMGLQIKRAEREEHDG
jgi:hypothetical protein